MLESDFQLSVTKELTRLLPGCMIIKGNSSRQPGIPDWLILYNDRWAALEVKKSSSERPRPNQPYYVDKMNSMSYAAFIYPENREEIIDEIITALRA
jgi:hypothetical protein